jgi:hypothetical protein
MLWCATGGSLGCALQLPEVHACRSSTGGEKKPALPAVFARAAEEVAREVYGEAAAKAKAAAAKAPAAPAGPTPSQLPAGGLVGIGGSDDDSEDEGGDGKGGS